MSDLMLNLSAGAVPDTSGPQTPPNLPQLPLPGGQYRVVDTARKAGQLLSDAGKFFIRDRRLFELISSDGEPRLEHVKADRFVSTIESVANVVSLKQGLRTPGPAIFTPGMARVVLEANEFATALPEIKCLTRCPVLIERDGRLIQVAGYDRPSGVLAGGVAVDDISLGDAKWLLQKLLGDFRFVSDADRSRALAALLSPALTFGGLLGNNRTPVTVVEADKSQTGKGFLVRLIAAVYRDVPTTIVQKKSGVGGLEEDFDTRVLEGRSFICLDNLRGKFDSPKLESFLTEGTYSARVPYAGSIQIDPRRTIVLLTSNRVELTTDFANRSNTVRLLKQPRGYAFTSYSEGGLPEHVQVCQPRYLGAVFAVITAWHSAGQQASSDIDHDFRRWAGVLDWIVVNILGEAPLLDGHREAQRRMATPHLNWLRDVAHAVESSGCLGDWMRPNAILDAIQRGEDIDIPGLSGRDIENSDVREAVFRAIGLRMKQCLREDDTCEVDGYVVQRRTTTDPRDRYRERPEYCFDRVPTPKAPRSSPEDNPEGEPCYPEEPEALSDSFVESVF